MALMNSSLEDWASTHAKTSGAGLARINSESTLVSSKIIRQSSQLGPYSYEQAPQYQPHQRQRIERECDYLSHLGFRAEKAPDGLSAEPLLPSSGHGLRPPNAVEPLGRRLGFE